MLDFLKQVGRDYDALFFIPHEDEDKMQIETKKFAEQSEKIGGSELGDCYHILLFKTEEDGTPKHLEMFDAILSKPLEYISELIPCDWYGVICKKTTSSSTYMNSIFDNLKAL